MWFLPLWIHQGHTKEKPQCAPSTTKALSGGIADTTSASYRNIGKKQSLARSARIWGTDRKNKRHFEPPPQQPVPQPSPPAAAPSFFPAGGTVPLCIERHHPLFRTFSSSREPRLPLPSWSAKNGHRQKKTTEFGSGDYVYQPYPLDTPRPTAHTADAHVTQGGMGKERICPHRWC